MRISLNLDPAIIISNKLKTKKSEVKAKFEDMKKVFQKTETLDMNLDQNRHFKAHLLEERYGAEIAWGKDEKRMNDCIFCIMSDN